MAMQHPLILEKAIPISLDQAAAPATREAAAYQGIGVTLARARERAGLALGDIAAKTRIRIDYLEALEQGQFSELPGRIYAVGFIKSYASCLGLDPMLAVETYKLESADLGEPEKLVFPVAIPERRTPSVKLVVAALLASSLVAYGAWDIIGGSSPTKDRVPPVPKHLAEQAAKPPVAAEVPPAAPAVPEPVAPPVVEAAAVPAIPIPTAKPPVPANFRVPEAAPRSPLVAAPIKPGFEPPASDESDELNASDAPPPPRVAVAAVPARAPVAVTPPAETGGVMRGGRVAIVAKTDTWLQIQGGGQAPLLARVLRAGERYAVPDVAGLQLTASDAAGIEVTIDGEVLPPLGAPGAVRRNIPLDPDRLRAAIP
jgi:cytoskeleton protein RodZ